MSYSIMYTWYWYYLRAVTVTAVSNDVRYDEYVQYKQLESAYSYGIIIFGCFKKVGVPV